MAKRKTEYHCKRVYKREDSNKTIIDRKMFYLEDVKTIEEANGHDYDTKETLVWVEMDNAGDFHMIGTYDKFAAELRRNRLYKNFTGTNINTQQQ